MKRMIEISEEDYNFLIEHKDEYNYERTRIAPILNSIPLNECKAEDCISRNIILSEIQEYLEEYSGLDSEGNHDLKWCAMKEAEMLVESAPSVYPKSDKPSGKWNHIKNYYICSECDCGIVDYEFLTTTNNYCRFCGAKMEQ